MWASFWKRNTENRIQNSGFESCAWRFQLRETNSGATIALINKMTAGDPASVFCILLSVFRLLQLLNSCNS
jgi:hypothetical protein